MIFAGNFTDRVEAFVKAANENQVRMILVGGGAVNFHGYQRHSADIDFWIDISEQNLHRLLKALHDLGFDIDEFPEKVAKGEQNISIKISPVFELELITNLNSGKSFNKAFNDSILVQRDGLSYHILNFEDLIRSKITSERTKDKLDVEALHKIRLKRTEPDK
jgi:hypothetical protein